MQPGTNDHAENIQKLRKIIKDIRVAMLTTTDTDGTLRSRPMVTQEQEFDGNLWFITGKSTHKAVEIDKDHHVNLSYVEPKNSVYASVSGNGRLVVDRKKAKELWNPLYKAWFPNGLDDPDLCLLHVTPEKAEYWDAPGGKVVQLLGFVEAAITGKRAAPGGHEQINLRE